MTNNQVRFEINLKIKGITFDLQCLGATEHAKKRNAKHIENLTVVLEDYKANLENVPTNDEPFDRDRFVLANRR